MIQHIGKITIYVESQEEARKFWIEKAGFVVKEEQPMGQGMTWLEVAPTKDSFTTFVLYEKKAMLAYNSMANVTHPNVILSCSDIEATYQTLQANGVVTGEMRQMPYGKMFTFQDQDGNSYMLRED